MVKTLMYIDEGEWNANKYQPKYKNGKMIDEERTQNAPIRFFYFVTPHATLNRIHHIRARYRRFCDGTAGRDGCWFGDRNRGDSCWNTDIKM
jgi:hypothetical protein